jgi:signal transduction histidine kinase
MELSMSVDDGGIAISVRDEGPGLSQEDMSRLFGRFQRLSARPTGGESSTGLGLSIVKRIVELHGGTVGAQSAGLGHGSTFIIRLPAAST